MNGAAAIDLATAPEDVAAIRLLFEAYAASLPVDLDYQDFSAELDGLPGKYATPKGALLLARGAIPLGCVGLRRLPQEGCCEMKRLYVRPEARGTGLGYALALAAIAAARRIGYRELRLDTLPTMSTAAMLYERIGFAPMAPYYTPTPAGTRFMALSL